MHDRHLWTLLLTTATIKKTSVELKSKPKPENLNGRGKPTQWALPTCLISTRPNTAAKAVPNTRPMRIAIDFKKPFVNLCKIRMMTNVTPPKIKFLGSP